MTAEDVETNENLKKAKLENGFYNIIDGERVFGGLAETVQTTHRGFTTNEPVELVVFYAGQAGLPITIKGL